MASQGRDVKLPWIFPGTPLKINGTPGNIQGKLSALLKAELGRAVHPKKYAHALLWSFERGFTVLSPCQGMTSRNDIKFRLRLKLIVYSTLQSMCTTFNKEHKA